MLQKSPGSLQQLYNEYITSITKKIRIKYGYPIFSWENLFDTTHRGKIKILQVTQM